MLQGLYCFLLIVNTCFLIYCNIKYYIRNNLVSPILQWFKILAKEYIPPQVLVNTERFTILNLVNKYTTCYTFMLHFYSLWISCFFFFHLFAAFLETIFIICHLLWGENCSCRVNQVGEDQEQTVVNRLQFEIYTSQQIVNGK